MYEITRRNLCLSAAATAALFGLDKPLTLIGSAYARSPTDLAPFVRFKVGDLTVTTVSDGVWSRDHDPNFIRNASVDDTKAALRAAGLPDDKVHIPFTVTFVETPQGLIMFDAGTGAQLAPTAGKLAANMQAAGIDPERITMIPVTHFHPDHIFGLMAKDTNAAVFPKARLVMPEVEYKYWTDPATLAATPEARQGLIKRITSVFPGWLQAGNIELAAPGKEIATGIRMVDSSGHTPGHAAFQVSSGNQQLMVLGDVSNIPALFVRNPGWHAMFDMDAQKAEATRRALYDRAIADNMMVSGYHFGMPGAGSITRDGNGYAFVPVAG